MIGSCLLVMALFSLFGDLIRWSCSFMMLSLPMSWSHFLKRGSLGLGTFWCCWMVSTMSSEAISSDGLCCVGGSVQWID